MDTTKEEYGKELGNIIQNLVAKSRNDTHFESVKTVKNNTYVE